MTVVNEFALGDHKTKTMAGVLAGWVASVLLLHLSLREQGMTSVVLAALGYRSPDDFNAKLPKSRLPAEKVISEL